MLIFVKPAESIRAWRNNPMNQRHTMTMTLITVTVISAG